MGTAANKEWEREAQKKHWEDLELLREGGQLHIGGIVARRGWLIAPSETNFPISMGKG